MINTDQILCKCGCQTIFTPKWNGHTQKMSEYIRGHSISKLLNKPIILIYAQCSQCSKNYKTVPYKRNKTKFCSMLCRNKWESINKRGPNHHSWKGNNQKTNFGYILIWAPNHPHAKSNYVLEHRLVMEKIIGRFLTPLEVVHHINKIRDDNRPENLQLMSSKSEHSLHHQSQRGWSKFFDKCISCGTIKKKHKARGYCVNCYETFKYRAGQSSKQLKGFVKKSFVRKHRSSI